MREVHFGISFFFASQRLTAVVSFAPRSKHELGADTGMVRRVLQSKMHFFINLCFINKVRED